MLFPLSSYPPPSVWLKDALEKLHPPVVQLDAMALTDIVRSTVDAIIWPIQIGVLQVNLCVVFSPMHMKMDGAFRGGVDTHLRCRAHDGFPKKTILIQTSQIVDSLTW